MIEVIFNLVMSCQMERKFNLKFMKSIYFAETTQFIEFYDKRTE